MPAIVFSWSGIVLYPYVVLPVVQVGEICSVDVRKLGIAVCLRNNWPENNEKASRKIKTDKEVLERQRLSIFIAAFMREYMAS